MVFISAQGHQRCATTAPTPTIARLTGKADAPWSGAPLLLPAPPADVRAGGPQQQRSNYQYTLQADECRPALRLDARKLEASPADPATSSTDVELRRGSRAGQADSRWQIDRDTAARLHLTPQLITNTLYDAFGQRSASVIYNALNQYHVVHGGGAALLAEPGRSSSQIWVSAAGGTANGSTASTNLIREVAPTSAGTTSGGGGPTAPRPPGP